MKKTLLTLGIAIASYCAYAQNTPWTGSGPVGIGTITPGQLLQVSGSSGAAISISTPWAGGAFGQLRFDTGVGNSSIRSYVPGNSTNGLQFFTYSGGETVKMTITGDGNVGIGSISPNTRLQVSGTISAIDALNTLNSSTPIITGSILGPTYSSWGVSINHVVENAGTNSYGMGLFTMDSYLTGRTEKMRITSNGNIGIGTIAPDEKLTVKGKIHAAEVKVEALSAIPDYVFEPKYKLIDLTELKTYLDKNHHLPEIPSAKQIEKEGINLGDMNMKLLKKVEELTLYLIEKDKQAREMEARINKLEEALKTDKTK